MDIILSISLCANNQKVGAACYSAVQPSQAAQCHGSSFRLQHDLLFLAQETQPVIQCSTLHYSYILNSVRFQTKSKMTVFAILRVPKMALCVPESKFQDHFSIQTSPQNPQKDTSGTKIGPRKVIFGHLINFAYF